MKVSVTLRSSDLEECTRLIEALRQTHYELVVRQAPNGLNYPYAFPVVLIEEREGLDRHFGKDAIAVLQALARRSGEREAAPI